MKLIKLSIVAFFSMLLSMNVNADQFDQWKPIQQSHINTQNQKVTPIHYHAFELDNAKLKQFLFTLSQDPSSASVIMLPNEYGTLEAFKIWESPMMEPELAIKFPEIKTFTAVSIEDPYITAKLDFTEYGLHGMIYGKDESIYIDPIDYFGGNQYQVYKKSAIDRADKPIAACKMGNDAQMDEILKQHEKISTYESPEGTRVARTHGNVKKNYRLALSCTGEYAQAVTGISSPTKAAVLSKMVTTMNRVNGIYQRELSVTMTLIANNENIIYTNPATDPFLYNNNGYFLLDENQANTQSVIGNTNYDIGHIFSTGGGGIASLGSVCRNTEKAMGVTGSPEPYGDPYDVDYVSHEMGHQFGANHTFNNCEGNENESTAFEPGSGSTIMGYAGICGTTNNLQNNSDDYFHPSSLNEISSYISGVSMGGTGSTCGTVSTGSGLISVPAYTNSYSIPTGTAFEVEAPDASWSGGSIIRYSWDQFNIGQIGRIETIGSTANLAPIFRSRNATSSKVRSFPRTDSVHRNNYSFRGERTPTVPRNLVTRLTIRGIAEDGYGSFNTHTDQVSVNYINTGSAFTVTNPNTGSVSWSTGSTQTVTWDVAGTTTSPISTNNVNIYLSKDGGLTYPVTLAANVSNSGTATFTVPEGSATTQARVKIKGAGNVFYDVSNVNFTITGSSTSINNNVLNERFDIYPNPAKDKINIKPLENTKSYDVHIYNILGQLMYNATFTNQSAIDITAFSNAVYHIEITDNNTGEKGNFKFVKQ